MNEDIVNLINLKEVQNIIHFCFDTYRNISAVNGRCKFYEESLKMNEEIFDRTMSKVNKDEKSVKTKFKTEAQNRLKLKKDIDIKKLKKNQEEIKKLINKKPEEKTFKFPFCPVS